VLVSLETFPRCLRLREPVRVLVSENVLRAGRARTHQLYSVLVFSSPENVAVFPSPRTCYVNEVDVDVAYAIT